MSRRLSKQLIIALIFLLILSGFGLLVYYFIQPAPSCFDKIQNQGEEGIDCGGPCSPCELVNIKEIEILWAKVLPGQNGFYDVAAQIKNPNQNYGSGQIPYHFELYDSQNNLVAQYSGSTFILPNQTKYLVQIKIKASQVSGQVNKVNLSFGEIEWQKLEDYQLPQLFIQEKEYHLLESQEPGFSQVRGILINKTNFDFAQVSLDVLLFDSFHQLLALNTTEVRTLLAGQERDFRTTWFKEIEGNVSSIEIEAETNVFDPDNYLPAVQRESERFQEY